MKTNLKIWKHEAFYRSPIRTIVYQLLGQEGFFHHFGIAIARKPDEVLTEEDLRNFLLTQYTRQGITVDQSNLSNKSLTYPLKAKEDMSGIN